MAWHGMAFHDGMAWHGTPITGHGMAWHKRDPGFCLCPWFLSLRFFLFGVTHHITWIHKRVLDFALFSQKRPWFLSLSLVFVSALFSLWCDTPHARYELDKKTYCRVASGIMSVPVENKCQRVPPRPTFQGDKKTPLPWMWYVYRVCVLPAFVLLPDYYPAEDPHVPILEQPDVPVEQQVRFPIPHLLTGASL